MEAKDVVATEDAAKSGSAPEIDVNAVLDAVVEAKSSDADDKGVKDGESPDADQPWHKDKRFKADLGLLKSAKAIMEANGIDDVSDLIELVEKGRKIKGKSVDLDRLDEIQEKAARLEKYEAYWEQQKKNQLREEDPDNYTKKLEEEIKELKGRDKIKAEKEAAAKEAQESVRFYERTVSELLEDAEDFPKEQHKFISLVMGVSNPTNDIDITDRKAIKKTYNSILKEVKAFADAMKQAGAAEYRKGKLEIPKVASSTPAAPVTEVKHNLKTARTALREVFMGKSG